MKPLRAWSEVVRLYYEKTGERVPEDSARAIASDALKKLRERLSDRGMTLESYR